MQREKKIDQRREGSGREKGGEKRKEKQELSIIHYRSESIQEKTKSKRNTCVRNNHDRL